MSTEVMTSLLAAKSNSSLNFPESSFPKTASLIFKLLLWWKSSKVTELTAPLTLLAIDLQASPTKSLTENSLMASCGSSLSTLKYQLYERVRFNLAWSEVSTIIMSVMKSGPKLIYKDWMTFSRLGLPPDNDKIVNCSSGPSMTRSGPKTTLDFFNLKSNSWTAELCGAL